MKCNIGKSDKWIRIVLGVALIVIGLLINNLIIAVVGLIPLGTALLNFCPLYTLVGVDTGCGKPEEKPQA